MKKIFLIFILSQIFISCSSKKDDPLIIPPNFAEVPDPKNPEKRAKSEIDEEQKKEIARLKELLLKSD